MRTLRTHLPTLAIIGLLIFFFGRLFYRPTSEVAVEGQEEALDIVTLLPKDGIPSIDDPQFYDASEADAEYAPEELVLGVAMDGEARAYSTGLLSRHEIVNDTVAGHPIAVTW